jgi:hypothetical protein
MEAWLKNILKNFKFFFFWLQMEAWLHDMRVLKEQEEAATQDATLKGKMWGEVRAPILSPTALL